MRRNSRLRTYPRIRLPLTRRLRQLPRKTAQSCLSDFCENFSEMQIICIRKGGIHSISISYQAAGLPGNPDLYGFSFSLASCGSQCGRPVLRSCRRSFPDCGGKGRCLGACRRRYPGPPGSSVSEKRHPGIIRSGGRDSSGPFEAVRRHDRISRRFLEESGDRRTGNLPGEMHAPGEGDKPGPV